MSRLGKFETKVSFTKISRWEYVLNDDLAFNDEKLGRILVPRGYKSDLASIRSLREVVRWTTIASLAIAAVAGFWSLPLAWLSPILLNVAIATLALYAVVVGYGDRASILHDWMYENNQGLSRNDIDSLYARALRSGDGVAKWRTAIFWIGVRLGGNSSFVKV